MFHTTPAVVGGFTAHKVTDEAETILQRIRDLVRGLSPHGTFPGPNPCSMEKADLKTISRSDNWLCEKTDGTRVMLAFLTYQGTKVAFLVTRSWDVYVIGIRCCPKVLFQGTVIDGELVFARGEWIWLGFDAMIVSGVPVWNLKLSERLAAAHRGFSAYQRHPKDSLRLSFKQYFKKFDDYVAYLQTSEYPTDGTIVTPEHLPIVLGRHKTLFKLKDTGKHTVDFEFQSPNILKVYDQSRKLSVQVGTLTRANQDLAPGTIVEASFSGNGGEWSLVTIRQDKTTSNDMLTYTKTMLNIRENLGLDDLRAHWAV
jgi:hypothetical protein